MVWVVRVIGGSYFLKYPSGFTLVPEAEPELAGVPDPEAPEGLHAVNSMEPASSMLIRTVNFRDFFMTIPPNIFHFLSVGGRFCFPGPVHGKTGRRVTSLTARCAFLAKAGVFSAVPE
jgi:hypothetical protein